MTKYLLDIEDLGILELDATISENEDMGADLSDYPVEDSKDATDNIILKNKTLALDVRFSGMGQDAGIYKGLPLPLLINLLGASPPSIDESYKDRYRKLERAFEGKKRMTVIRPDDDPLTNMVITGISKTTDKRTGLMIACQVSFSQIQVKGIGVAQVPMVQLGKSAETKFGQEKPEKNKDLKTRNAKPKDAGRVVPKPAAPAKSSKLSSVAGMWEA